MTSGEMADSFIDHSLIVQLLVQEKENVLTQLSEAHSKIVNDSSERNIMALYGIVTRLKNVHQQLKASSHPTSLRCQHQLTALRCMGTLKQAKHSSLEQMAITMLLQTLHMLPTATLSVTQMHIPCAACVDINAI